MEKLHGSLLGLKINGIFVPCETSCDFNFETEMRPASPVDVGGWKEYIAGARSWSISLNAAMLLRMVGTGLPLVLNAFMKGQRIDVQFSTRRLDLPNFIITGKAYVLNGGISALVSSRASWNTTLTGDGAFNLEVNSNIAYVFSSGIADEVIHDGYENLLGGYIVDQENMKPETYDPDYTGGESEIPIIVPPPYVPPVVVPPVVVPPAPEVGKVYFGVADTLPITYAQIVAGAKLQNVTSRSEYTIPFNTNTFRYLWFAESVSLYTKTKYADSANILNNGSIGGDDSLFGSPTIIAGTENFRVYVTNYKTVQTSTFKITT